jgi:hypothetical protein
MSSHRKISAGRCNKTGGILFLAGFLAEEQCKVIVRIFGGAAGNAVGREKGCTGANAGCLKKVSSSWMV